MVSILILNWNAKKYLFDCVQSIQDKVTLPYEILVEDNGSTDGSPDELVRRFPDVRLIRSEDNLGFAGGNNLAARHAQGKYLLLLNNDTLLQTDIRDALEIIEADPGIGVVGALMFRGDGTSWPSAARFPTPSRLWRFANLQYDSDRPPTLVGGVPVHRCDSVEGSFLLTPASLWKQVGGMDERNYMYGDDVEYCRSLWEAGYATVLCTSVRYTHFGGYDHSRMAYLFGGFRRYHRKFSGPLTRLHADFVLRTGLLLRLPWYWWKGRRGDAQSRSAFEHALHLQRHWKETGIDAFRHHS